MEFNHYSVLLNETIENLNIKPDGIYVDGTLGGGGLGVGGEDFFEVDGCDAPLRGGRGGGGEGDGDGEKQRFHE